MLDNYKVIPFRYNLMVSIISLLVCLIPTSLPPSTHCGHTPSSAMNDASWGKQAACMMAWCPAPQPSAWPDLTYLWWPRTTTKKTTALVTSSSTLQPSSTSGNCCVNICEKGNAKRCNGNLIHRFVAGTRGTCKDTKGHSTRGVPLRH